MAIQSDAASARHLGTSLGSARPRHTSDSLSSSPYRNLFPRQLSSQSSNWPVVVVSGSSAGCLLCAGVSPNHTTYGSSFFVALPCSAPPTRTHSCRSADLQRYSVRSSVHGSQDRGNCRVIVPSLVQSAGAATVLPSYARSPVKRPRGKYTLGHFRSQYANASAAAALEPDTMVYTALPVHGSPLMPAQLLLLHVSMSCLSTVSCPNPLCRLSWVIVVHLNGR